jgi:hypothetical protein
MNYIHSHNLKLTSPARIVNLFEPSVISMIISLAFDYLGRDFIYKQSSNYIFLLNNQQVCFFEISNIRSMKCQVLNNVGTEIKDSCFLQYLSRRLGIILFQELKISYI